MFGEELQTANGMYDVLMSFIFFFLLSVSAHLYHSFNVTFTFSFDILYIHNALTLTSRVVYGLWTLACQICPLSLYHQNKLVIFFIFEGTKRYMLEIIFKTRIFIHLLKWARMLGIAKYVPKLCVQLNPLLVFLWLPKLDCWKCRTIEFYWSENEHSVWVLSSPSQCCSWLEYSFTIFILFCSFWYVWALQFESLIVLIPLYNPVYLALFWLGKHWSHIWNLVPLCLMWCIWRERIGRHLRTWIDPMTNCLLSFLVPFMIGLGLGDSHLVILFLYSLALSIFVFSVFFFFMFLLLHLFCTVVLPVLLCI